MEVLSLPSRIRKVRKSINLHSSVVFSIHVFIFEEIRAISFYLAIEHERIIIALCSNVCLPSFGREIVKSSFLVLTVEFKSKMYNCGRQSSRLIQICPCNNHFYL